ncbi:hypothetical protein C8046_13960 [Serinibacter arcticus]|uniref:DUF4352 domain-containing protein n=1 Tax=Serinibacter arcticus TaxID=1655435 RepID=A0A2U1ZXB3_9MICO|nr:hypothetical protein [Serinibacter arcticus]PWD51583.1 hypothetical protein C8046_13960 [Serinibacter arcticus]
MSGADARRRLTPGAVVPGVVLLALAMGLGVHEANRKVVPTVATTIHGTVGQELAVGGTRVEVLGASTAPVVRVEGTFSDEVTEPTTTGEWLVLRVRFAGEREPSAVRRYVWRDTEGVEYQTSQWFDYGYPFAQPDEWWHEDVVFEVPPAALESGTLLLLPEGQNWALPMEVGAIRVDDVEVVDVIDAVDATVGEAP